jgi:lipid II:glycine glycyltransferase (peptidoglycan interpeptide bridge formation enzyme)
MSYQVIIDDFDHAEWVKNAKNFADYSIYQTWPYQEMRANTASQELSRVIVKDEKNEVVTMCHIRIRKASDLGPKIGYVQHGPMVRAADGRIVCSVEALKALRRAYLGKKISVFRITPNVSDDETRRQVSQMLKSGGFKFVNSISPYRTLMLSLDGSEEEIQKSLDRNFRRNLKKAEKAGIEIREGRDVRFCEILRELYEASVKRKGFKGLDPDEFIEPQLKLSSEEKMNFIVAYYENEPVSVHLASHLGDTGVALLVASNEKGLECGSSYLIWWKACIAAKNAGMRRLDLGGIDPDNNPGGYRFKSQISRQEYCCIGAFDACSSLPVKMAWRASEKVYNIIKK